MRKRVYGDEIRIKSLSFGVGVGVVFGLILLKIIVNWEGNRFYRWIKGIKKISSCLMWGSF